MLNFFKRALFRVWAIYAIFFLILFNIFDRNQVADDVLNAARPSADYLHFFAYKTKPYNKAEIKRALAYYQTLILGKFSTAAMHANLGFCYYYLNDLPKAINSYEEAIQKDQRLYTSYYDLGVIMLRQKKYAQAQDLFKKAIFLMPSTKEALLNMLHISPKYQQQPMFEYFFQQRVPWDMLLAHVHLLESLNGMKENEEMLRVALEALKKFPYDPEINYYASLATYNLGLKQESLAFVQASLNGAPEFFKAYELKANLLSTINDPSVKEYQALAKKYQTGGWHRNINIEDLHHWDENTLLFQIYR